MDVQSRGVAEVLAGKDSGWESQRRDDGSLPFSSLLRSYGGLTFLGVLAALMSWSISPALAAWMSPVILGLLLSIPIVMLTSTSAAGQWLRRRRLFRKPEEMSPPPVSVWLDRVVGAGWVVGAGGLGASSAESVICADLHGVRGAVAASAPVLRLSRGIVAAVMAGACERTASAAGRGLGGVGLGLRRGEKSVGDLAPTADLIGV